MKQISTDISTVVRRKEGKMRPGVTTRSMRRKNAKDNEGNATDEAKGSNPSQSTLDTSSSATQPRRRDAAKGRTKRKRLRIVEEVNEDGENDEYNLRQRTRVSPHPKNTTACSTSSGEVETGVENSQSSEKNEMIVQTELRNSVLDESPVNFELGLQLD